MERIQITEEFEVGVKRFYLPIKVKRDCPKCKSKLTCDLGENYLFQPVINKKETITFFCESCDDHYETDAVLKIELQVDEKLKQ